MTRVTIRIMMKNIHLKAVNLKMLDKEQDDADSINVKWDVTVFRASFQIDGRKKSLKMSRSLLDIM